VGAVDGEDTSEYMKDHIFELRRKICLHIFLRSSNICVAGFPVLFMYFSRRLVPAFKSRDPSSVHVMANVGKRCSCVCDSLEVTTDKTDKTDKDADD